MGNLREAAQQALDALECLDGYNGWVEVGEEIDALRAALADTQDWDEIEALRASLREHMAEIHRLRAVCRQALEALERAGEQLRWQSIGQAQHDLRSALKPVTDCHDKEGDNLPPSLDVPETNFGNMAQAVDCYGDGNVYQGQRSRDSETKTITFSKVETVEPVAYVTGYFEGRCVIKPFDSMLLPVGMALYRSPPNQSEDALGMVEPVAWITPGQELHFSNYEGFQDWVPLYTVPPKREPLTEQQIMEIEKRVHFHESPDWPIRFARELERAHGIGGDE